VTRGIFFSSYIIVSISYRWWVDIEKPCFKLKRVILGQTSQNPHIANQALTHTHFFYGTVYHIENPFLLPQPDIDVMQALNSQHIIESLEQAALVCEDPTSLVYQRLFHNNPELEDLFLMDRNDEAKGHMLYEVVEAIIDFVGPKYTSEGLIVTEVINHRQIGVPIEVFETFFTTVRDTFRDMLGTSWNSDFEKAWTQLLLELSHVVNGQPAN
jgi:hemoglobin-like flavoprotein